MKFCHEILETLGYHTAKTQTHYLTWAWIGTGSRRTNGQTNRQTNGQTELP